jgi:sRNA-binding protein
MAKQLSPTPRTTFNLKYKNCNPMKTVKTLTLLTICVASIAMADDFKTIAGKEYKDATVTRVETDGILVKYKSGISKLYFTELPEDVQKRFHYGPGKAAAAQAAAAQQTEELNKQSRDAAEVQRKQQAVKDFKTVNGKEYKNAEVTHVEPDGIVLKIHSGISKVYFTELPKEIQQRFNYDPQRAIAYIAVQAAARQKTNEQLGKEQENRKIQ